MFPAMSLRKNSNSQTPIHILLVDDNAHGLMARRTVLEELGHKIITASNGADALDLATRQSFDLVVTDYKMPHMNGVELINHLRNFAPHIPVVLISGFVDALGLNEANTGADAVVQKSSNEITHLVRAVSRLKNGKLRRKGAATEARPLNSKRTSA
jgi:CheY-like chemotaxis protein